MECLFSHIVIKLYITLMAYFIRICYSLLFISFLLRLIRLQKNQAALFKGIIQFNPGLLQEGKGTGLGLYISKGIMDLHHGHLWVESEGEGLGATFAMLIPVKNTSAIAANNSWGGDGDLESSAKSRQTMDDDVEKSRENIFRCASSDSSSPLCTTMAHSRIGSNVNLSAAGSNIAAYTTALVDDDLCYEPGAVYCFASDDHDASDSAVMFSLPSSTKDTSFPAAATASAAALRMQSSSEGLKDSSSDAARGSPSPDSDLEQQRVINILIVDDSSTCRIMTRKALMASAVQGCELVCELAQNGEVAVDMVRSNLRRYADRPPSALHDTTALDNDCKQDSDHSAAQGGGLYDIILMDYQMPVMAGPEAISQIRKLGYKGTIVGLTGNVLSLDMKAMTDAGADKVLAKPVNQHDLEMLIVDEMKLNSR